MTSKQTQTEWDNDPQGRINNISLAPNAKNALFPMFEAVMNSIHAIEERFGRDNLAKGNVDIRVTKSANGEYSGFQVTDNRCGFNQENIDSFKRMDSRTKAKIGGKGVGRLLWLKVADEVQVSSVFQNGSSFEHVTFEFCVEKPLRNFQVKTIEGHADFLTNVDLSKYFDLYANSIPKKLDTIANRVLAHFISYFINISHPKICVHDNKTSIDLFDQFSESIERDNDYKFDVEIGSESCNFTLHCFLLPKVISDDEKSTNALYLGANGRAVQRFDMDGVLGLKAIKSKFAFLGYVESKTLDDSVNETRTAFSLSEDDIEEIVDRAKNHAKEFLQPELAEIREKQTSTVSNLRIEHPRVRTY